MTNEEMLREYSEVKAKVKKAFDEQNWAEREIQSKRKHELLKKIDWGYQAGDDVERWSPKRWKRDTIIKIEGTTVFFKSVVMPLELIRPAKERYEQLNLLNF